MTRPHSAANTPPAPPLIHRIAVATLGREDDADNSFRLSPDAEARARIARFLDIEAVERMTLTVRLLPRPDDGWEAKGQLTATVVQSCVVTLEPVRGVIDTAVRRRYVHDPDMPESANLELGEDDLDPPDAFDRHIDLGQLAVETLALMLDPWPRAEGAEFDQQRPGQPGLAALGEENSRPFASLAELRARLGRDKD